MAVTPESTTAIEGASSAVFTDAARQVAAKAVAEAPALTPEQLAVLVDVERRAEERRKAEAADNPAP